MLTGHASHQVGLDADIWLTPMPDRKLSAEEREFMSATNMVREDRLDVDPKVWTHQHTELIRTAAEDPDVERIFVNAAIKKALCREAGPDRAGSPKCGRGGATTIISTFACSVRPTARSANRNPSRRRAKAAAMTSISGSRQACCIRRRRRSRRSRGRR